MGKQQIDDFLMCFLFYVGLVSRLLMSSEEKKKISVSHLIRENGLDSQAENNVEHVRGKSKGSLQT